MTWLLVVMPLPAGAQETLSSGLRMARALLERQQYEQALTQVRGLRQPELSSEQSLTVALYEGLILAHLGPSRQSEALAAFKAVLLQDPQVRLPLKASPRIAREFEQARTQALAERRAAFASLESRVTPLGVVMPGDEVTATHVLIPTLAGGGLAVSGGVFWALARRERSRLENNDPSLDTDEKVRSAAARGKTYQTLGFSLLGAGAASLGIAATLYMRRKSQLPVTLGVGMNGASIVASGSWP
jgi:hypothetical protein